MNAASRGPLEVDPYQPQDPISLDADNGAAIVSSIDNSVNKALPYIWFNGVLAALALGLAVGAVFIAFIKADTLDVKVDVIRERATVGENHWRNAEVDIKALQGDVKKLQREDK